MLLILACVSYSEERDAEGREIGCARADEQERGKLSRVFKLGLAVRQQTAAGAGQKAAFVLSVLDKSPS